MALSEIVLIGLNHKVASVEVRERLAFSDEEALSFLRGLRDAGAIRGGVLLSTCNRVELYADFGPNGAAETLVNTMLASRGLAEGHRGLFYVKQGRELISHLFGVAAGLDSMVLGEPQILGQVKDSYFLSRDGGVLTTPLNLLFQKAFHVAKKVRTETGIGERPVTISFAAFNLARSIFEDLATKRILILGAGEMSRILATHFFESGIRQVKVANRTYERALTFAKAFGAEVVPWDTFPRAMVQSDIVISSTGAPNCIIHKAMMETVMKLRRNASMLIIDIAVPRDVESSVAKLDGAYLYNVDDLQEVADEGLEQRKQKAEAAGELIASEVEFHERYLEHQELSGIIEGVVTWANTIQEAEMSEALRKIGEITPKQQDVLRKAIHRVAHKILHNPITSVKRLVVEEDVAQAADIFRELFPVQEEQRENGLHPGGSNEGDGQ